MPKYIVVYDANDNPTVFESWDEMARKRGCTVASARYLATPTQQQRKASAGRRGRTAAWTVTAR